MSREMQNGTHTPGPWETAGLTVVECGQGDTLVVAACATPADLALMAAAPAMLEALRGLLFSAEALHQSADEWTPEPASFAAARQAIAHAEGGAR